MSPQQQGPATDASSPEVLLCSQISPSRERQVSASTRSWICSTESPEWRIQLWTSSSPISPYRQWQMHSADTQTSHKGYCWNRHSSRPSSWIRCGHACSARVHYFLLQYPHGDRVPPHDRCSRLHSVSRTQSSAHKGSEEQSQKAAGTEVLGGVHWWTKHAMCPVWKGPLTRREFSEGGPYKSVQFNRCMLDACSVNQAFLAPRALSLRMNDGMCRGHVYFHF